MRRAGRALALVAVAGVAGCGDDSWVTDPAGETADRLAGLWWLMLGLGTAVWLLVMGVLVRAVLRARRGVARRAPRGSGVPLVVAGGIVLPIVVLVPLLVVIFDVGDDLAAGARTGEGEDGAVDVRIVGEQFWWRVAYPAADVVDANEVHVPVGREVVVELRSNDVIHSFWVPEVAGKRDLIPGETTVLRFQVDEPGVYRGFCAEFCGIQHARMRLVLVAHEPEDYEEVLARLAADAEEPDDPLEVAGLEVFLETGCAGCHTIRGTDAVAGVGPDLTHLASRLTIGAGTFPNTRGHLAGWVVDAQGMKPGALMPPQPLEPDELQALLAYLETLE